MSSPLLLPTSILALSLLGVTACQPATQSDDAATPEAIAEPASAGAETAIVEISAPQETAASATEAQGETEAAEDHDDHADEAHPDDHNAHAEHDDDGHDNHAEHEGHDSHDEEHDHADPDSAGGEAHLHGHAELALTQTGDTLSVSLISPLANFGLSEASADLTDAQAYADNLIRLSGGDCSETERHVHAKSDGQHGTMEIEITYSCAAIDSLTSATIVLFETYTGFEEIDAVLLTPTEQVAAELTATAPTLTFP